MARDLKSLGAAFHAASPAAASKRGTGEASDDIDEVSRAIDGERSAEIDAAVQAQLGTVRASKRATRSAADAAPVRKRADPPVARPRSRRTNVAPVTPPRIKTSVSLPVTTAELLRSAAAEIGVSADGMLMRMYLDVHDVLQPTRQNEELLALGIVPARRPRGEPTVVMSISLTPEAAKRLDDLAERLGVSRSAAVDRVIRTARPNA